VAVAMTNAALKSIDRKGQCVAIEEVMEDARAKSGVKRAA
jgi:hypothetical protein